MENYFLPEDADENLFPSTDKEKIENNIKVIKLVIELSKNGQQATPEQQAKLATYVGWGGLANEFFDEYNEKYATQREELKSLISKKEYESMKASSLTAYYTNPAIARAMWQKVMNDGLTHGNILDPSMGTGIFPMTMPKELRDKVDFYGIEIDKITGLIAKQLFPNFHIIIKGFQDVNFLNSEFDLVITNVPFGDTRLLDENSKSYYIHDYFLKRSLGLVRNFGEVAIITSTGLMDKRSGNILQKIKDNVDFLGGVRLPDNAFKKIAGTKVTTDVLYFMRDDSNNSSVAEENKEAFDNAKQFPTDDRVFVNPYFLNRREKTLGFVQIQNFHGATLTVVNNEHYLPSLIHNLSDLTTPSEFAESDNYGDKVIMDKGISENSNVPEQIKKLRKYEFDYVGNNIYYRNGSKIVKNAKPTHISLYVEKGTHYFVAFKASQSKINEFKDYTDDGKKNIFDHFVSSQLTTTGKYKGYLKSTIFYYIDYSDSEKARIKGLIDIKKAYANVINIQLQPNYDKAVFAKLLKHLNFVYDSFVESYGVINDRANAKMFESDDRFPLIASLEDHKLDDRTGNQVYVKSQAFFEPLVTPDQKRNQVSNALDALLTSVSEARGVDFNFMKSIYPNHSEEEIKNELGDNILIDVQLYTQEKRVKYVTKDELLSGDVVTKNNMAKALAQKNDTTADWEHYTDLLKNVIPEPLTIADISFRLASSWVPDKVLTKFLYSNFADPSSFADLPENAIVHTPQGRTISEDAYPLLRYTTNSMKYKVERNGDTLYHYSDAATIIDYLLLSKQPTIQKIVGYDKKDKPIEAPDEVATAQLRTVEKTLEELFHKFVIENAEMAKLTEDTYNDLYNRYVDKKYDGSHLHINGLAKNYHLRDYQKNAVQRIIETKRALLAHEVGTGKTLTMISTGFKLKELGIIHRPLYIVPTNLTAQFGQDILKFYPTKNVLITSPEDFKKQNRKRFLARIISNDYDAVVIGHSQFEKISVSQENYGYFYQDIIDQLQKAMNRYKEDGEEISVKNIERMKKSYENKLTRLRKTDQDTFLNFEDLGIDFMFVDEAHNYKNIAPVTRLGRIKGINARTSQRAFDMQMKVRLLQQKYDFGHVVFATGTPVSNSISELWTMMSYIQPDVLTQMKIDSFDAFVGSFGLIKSQLELNTTGDKYKEQKRFIKFVNLPELMTIYKMTADVQMADQLNLKIPKAKRFVIKSELTPAQKNKLQELIDRTDKIQAREVTPEEDNMLKITNEARKLTLDMRLFSTSKFDSNDSEKLKQVADNVFRIYKRTSNVKGTQMIFSDLGTPTNNSTDFDVYNEIKRLLVNLGIPAKQIAFMHDAKDDDQKIKLQCLVNAGDVRILIASTQKGGTGLNVQRRMKAAHHLDVPWRPSDIIQRNGRLVRQGNIFKQVEIYHYITKGSFDNYLWQIIENKLKYITQIMTSNLPIRAMKDVDSETLTASEFKSIATNNPYLKLKMKVDNQLSLLGNRKNAFERNHRANVRSYQEAQKKLPVFQNRLNLLQDDLETIKDVQVIDISDIKFPEFPTSYDKSADLNTRLYNEICKIVYHNLEDGEERLGYKTIATIKGFNIDVGYASKFTSTSEISAYSVDTYTTIYLTKQGRYPITLNLSNFKHSDYGVKIRNQVVGIKGLLKKWSNIIQRYKRVIDLGIGSDEFEDQDKLEYLAAKKKVLDPLIAQDSKVAKIQQDMNQFELSWKQEHPDFIVSDADKQDIVQTKYSSNPNDYDDSLFEFLTKEQIQSKPKNIIPAFRTSDNQKPKNNSVIIPVKKFEKPKKEERHTHIFVTTAKKGKKYKTISLFDLDVDEEKGNKGMEVQQHVKKQVVQTTLF
jgi:N12 class adenine-specific DNA methylase